MTRTTRAVGILVLPGAAALAFLLLASVFPVRLDYRTFQALRRLEPLDLPRENANVIFLSEDGGQKSAELFAFALPVHVHPAGSALWVTLPERTAGPWMGAMVGVTREGELVASTGGDSPGWRAEPSLMSQVARYVKYGAVLYTSAESRKEFERRLPLLESAKRVLYARPADEVRGFSGRTPGTEITLARWLRLFAVFGIFTALVTLGRRGMGRGAPALLTVGIAATVAAMLTVCLVYLFSVLQPGAGPGGIWLLWSVLTISSLVLPGEDGQPGREPVGNVELAGGISLALLVVVIFVARLDFDGDTYTTYLSVAREFGRLGEHDPGGPVVRNLVQGAVYPPGGPILLWLPAWLMDSPADETYRLGGATTPVILLYRVAISGIVLSAAAAAWAVLMDLSGSAGWATAGTIALLWFAPPLRGVHVAIETLIVPVSLVAMAALIFGQLRRNPVAIGAGAFLGGAACLLKRDAMVYGAFLVAPLLANLLRRDRLREVATAGISTGLGLIPGVIWLCSGVPRNTSMVPVSVAAVLERQTVLPGILGEGARILIREDFWVPLGLMVAIGVVLLSQRKANLREYAVPVGVLACTAAWVAVYMFSTLGPRAHMQTSLPRLLSLPAVAAILFSVSEMARRENDGA